MAQTHRDILIRRIVGIKLSRKRFLRYQLIALGLIVGDNLVILRLRLCWNRPLRNARFQQHPFCQSAAVCLINDRISQLLRIGLVGDLTCHIVAGCTDVRNCINCRKIRCVPCNYRRGYLWEGALWRTPDAFLDDPASHQILGIGPLELQRLNLRLCCLARVLIDILDRLVHRFRFFNWNRLMA